MSIDHLILDSYSAIETYLRDNWTESNNIDWENTTIKNLVVPYIRPAFIPLTNVRVEIGENGSGKLDCILSVDVFDTKGAGKYKSSVMISELMNIFAAGTTITTDYDRTIHFKTPEPLQSKDGKNGLWQSTVHCPWYVYDH